MPLSPALLGGALPVLSRLQRGGIIPSPFFDFNNISPSANRDRGLSTGQVTALVAGQGLEPLLQFLLRPESVPFAPAVGGGGGGIGEGRPLVVPPGLRFAQTTPSLRLPLGRALLGRF